MKAITLTQPWAGLVASGIKLVENRPRRIAPRDLFGQRFAIHASRTIDEAVYDRIFELAPELDDDDVSGAPWYLATQRTSAVIAVATLDSEVAMHNGWPSSDLGDGRRITVTLGGQGRWFFGPIGYVLRDVVALPRPVPCRGMLGFWSLPADVERMVEEQIA